MVDDDSYIDTCGVWFVSWIALIAVLASGESKNVRISHSCRAVFLLSCLGRLGLHYWHLLDVIRSIFDVVDVVW